MAGHKYQLAVNDMKTAGINPVLAVGGGTYTPPTSSMSSNSITQKSLNIKAIDKLIDEYSQNDKVAQFSHIRPN